jgi:hypothetical protein
VNSCHKSVRGAIRPEYVCFVPHWNRSH